MSHSKVRVHPIITMTQFYFFSVIYQLAIFPLFTDFRKFYSLDPIHGAFGWLSSVNKHCDSFVYCFSANRSTRKTLLLNGKQLFFVTNDFDSYRVWTIHWTNFWGRAWPRSHPWGNDIHRTRYHNSWVLNRKLWRKTQTQRGAKKNYWRESIIFRRIRWWRLFTSRDGRPTSQQIISRFSENIFVNVSIYCQYLIIIIFKILVLSK